MKKKPAKKSSKSKATAANSAKKPKAAKKSVAAAGFAPAMAGAPLAAAAGPLPPDDKCMDINVIGHPAGDDAERRSVLEHAVTSVWPDDVSLIQRVESQGRAMWVMWKRGTVPPA